MGPNRTEEEKGKMKRKKKNVVVSYNLREAKQGLFSTIFEYLRRDYVTFVIILECL